MSDDKSVIPGELVTDDCFCDVDKFNAEADRVKKAAKEAGFIGVILPDGKVGKLSE